MTAIQGKVVSFNDDSGYGWIAPSDGGQDIFVHIRDVNALPNRLFIGEFVEFDTAEGEKGLRAVSVKRLESRVLGIVKKFDVEKGYGFAQRKDNGKDVFIHHNDIVGKGYHDLFEGDEIEFSVIRAEKGFQAIRITIEKTIKEQFPPLNEFADLEDLEGHLEELVNLAHKENWSYKYTTSKHNYPILYNYLFDTFDRLAEEGKIAKAETGKEDIACFNTGLVTEMQEEIYGVFVSNKTTSSKLKWKLQGFFKESERILTHFGKRPDIANYFQEPSELLYDTRVTLVVNVEHVIVDNKDRFPEEVRNNTYALRGLLDGAISAAKSRVRRNYKTAIPQFYKGKLQLLLPLCLMTPERADLALVVARENEVYRGTTVLTLDMAYNNARLIARPDNEWLEP